MSVFTGTRVRMQPAAVETMALLWQRGPILNETSYGSFISICVGMGLRGKGPHRPEKYDKGISFLSLCSGCHRFRGSTYTVAGHRVLGNTYWSGQLWCGYGCAGVVQFHPTAQVKVTDFHWRHLQRKTEGLVLRSWGLWGQQHD